MLKKQFRLTTDFHFNVTRKYGKKYFSKFFTVYICKPTNYRGTPKIGIITPNTFDKSAVKRNRAKRVLSEIVRLGIDNIPENTWVLIYPKPAIFESNHEEISNELNKILSDTPVIR